MSSITETSSAATGWSSTDIDWQGAEPEDTTPAPDLSSSHELAEGDASENTIDAAEPSADVFGLPEHGQARIHALATAPVDPLDDGLSCRRDDETPPDDSPIRGGVTVRDGQGILSALQAAGVPQDNLRAAYGSLVSSGQLRGEDFDGSKPVVRPGRTFQLDSAQFTDANARLGGQLIGNENASRLAEEAAVRRTEAPRPVPARQPAQPVRPTVEEPAQGTLERLRDQVASSTLILAEPIVRNAATAARWFGADVNPQEVSDNMFGAASELITGRPLPQGSTKVSYTDAMSLPMSPLGISKYDYSNITFHDYEVDTTLCRRSESFCTIPNLSPLVDHSSAPKVDWTGFKPMEDGPQRLIFGHPIVHQSNYQVGHFVNRTQEGHVFHSGTVESQLYWKGDELHLKTVGYGYGATPMHAVANYAVGLSYFPLWQAAVKAQVHAMRMSHPQ